MSSNPDIVLAVGIGVYQDLFTDWENFRELNKAHGVDTPRSKDAGILISQTELAQPGLPQVV